ncbi:efflux RND transporter periplasmic adaptor subunit [Thalassotalea sp. M1531]|uniref:Efflux RND transporter periplasmic adaptor subunit n=1 Tax=Thalassotalea algicola TaxID=2716224 RepID=A0A7Y0LAB2_9GAMM|nr:efflux RND transporter periplasmic adaptor subunit [Thalassotalea algicola]NMP30879.1 efflux RND transporter periplasmic adaptor subunit [Thalassotalea algicola]
MIKGIKWSILLIALVALFWWLTQEKPVKVTWVSPSIGSVESIVANTRSGTVEACQRAKLSFPIGGQIEHIHVEEGDIVKKNEPLMTLWQRDRLAKVAEAKALVSAKTRNQESVCITASNDQKIVARNRQLLKQKLTSEEALDNAQAIAQASKAACLSAHSEIDIAKAMLETAIASLDQTELYAPFDGMVAEITGELGEYATPSPPGIPMPPAIDMLTHDCHYISAPIDEIDAGQLALGMPVTITIDAFSNRSFNGKVKRIAPYVQDYAKQARTVDVDVSFDDVSMLNNTQLLTGYSADISIRVNNAENALRIASDLIVDGRYVYLLDEQGIIRQKEVSTGISNWQLTEITAGLDKNDRIISSLAVEGFEVGRKAIEDTSPGGVTR